mmetsp:Transcript_19451/g.44121  ORF Transcript_19451/g.44121 Transcript_19451/m.44121 type:complete len:223 (-) Transcript_19451:653-1321(-)
MIDLISRDGFVEVNPLQSLLDRSDGFVSAGGPFPRNVVYLREVFRRRVRVRCRGLEQIAVVVEEFLDGHCCRSRVAAVDCAGSLPVRLLSSLDVLQLARDVACLGLAHGQFEGFRAALSRACACCWPPRLRHLRFSRHPSSARLRSATRSIDSSREAANQPASRRSRFPQTSSARLGRVTRRASARSAKVASGCRGAPRARQQSPHLLHCHRQGGHHRCAER